MHGERFFPKPSFAKEDEKGADNKSLPQVDKHTGFYTDPSGRKWASPVVLAEYFRVGPNVILARTEGKSVLMGRMRSGIRGPLYALDELEQDISKISDLPQIDRDSRFYKDSSGREWGSMSDLAKFYGVSRQWIASRIDKKSILHGRDRTGKIRSLYAVDEFESDSRKFGDLPRADRATGIYTDTSGRRWAPLYVIADYLGIGAAEIKTRRKGKSTLEGRDKSEKASLFFSLDEFEVENMQLFSNLHTVERDGFYKDQAGKQWGTLGTLAKYFGVTYDVVNAAKEGKPTLAGRDRSGKKSTLYAINDFESEARFWAALPQVDEETKFYTDASGRKWASPTSLAGYFGVNPRRIQLRTEGKSVLKGRVLSGRLETLYALDEFLPEISRISELPHVDRKTGFYTDTSGRKWAGIRTLAEHLGVTNWSALQSRQNKTYLSGRDKGGKVIKLYALDEFQAELRSIKTEADVVAKHKEMIDGLGRFLTQESAEGRKFHDIIFALGLEVARDVLFMLRPEFASLPSREIDTRLSEYLGEYAPPKPFPISAVLEKIEPLLKGNAKLQELLLASIKREGQRAYFGARKASEAPDVAPFNVYFAELTNHLTTRSPELEAILEQAWSYFTNDVIGELDLPDSLVHEIIPGRPFPDIYQRINVNEIKHHQRYLIADEMGVGKSASAILAKESMRMKCALVVAPATVCTTWERYLSDQVEDGRQKGYFKPGQAPNALVIKDIADIGRLETEDFDYVVMPRERLNNHYMDALRGLEFDMLVVDEVHQYKKGEKGTLSQSLGELAKKIDSDDKRLVLLSGTPVPNKVRDVAMLLKLLQPEFQDRSITEIRQAIFNEGDLAARVNLLPLMQMKSLADHVDMPNLFKNEVLVQLSPDDKEEYEYLIGDDTLEPQVKMQLLRRFLLNGDSVFDVSNRDRNGQESSKVVALKKELSEALKTKNKIVVFVNDHIENVIRGEGAILAKLGLPEDVGTYVIHGDDEKGLKGRQETRDAFRNDTKPSVIFLSGQTEHSGVDYSFADHVVFYNEPWTYAAFQQQLARVYRPGLQKALTYTTLITEGTLEEGIHEYVKAKHATIEKLLRGGHLSENEKALLLEENEMEDIEVNAGVAKQYLSGFGNIMRLFGRTKERGQAQLIASLGDGGLEYAQTYEKYAGRSYQDNSARVCANLIREMAKDQAKPTPEILDMGSGPAMLYRRAPASLQDHVVSLDINRNHFEGKKLGMTVVGGMTDTPFPSDASEMFDYVNMSLAIQDTAYRPEDGEYERIYAFSEAARMLRTGGRFIVHMQNTLDFRSDDDLVSVLGKLGLEKVPAYTGEIVSGTKFKSHVLVLEKKSTPESSIDDIVAELSPEELRSFRFLNKTLQQKRLSARGYLKHRDRIISDFSINGRQIGVEFNPSDAQILSEETKIIEEVESLKKALPVGKQSIRNIPKEELIQRVYSRLVHGNGGKSGRKEVRLFKHVPGDGGISLD